MSLNPASNFSNLAQLSTAVLGFVNNSGTSPTVVDNTIQVFLNNVNEINYNTMLSALTAALTANATGANASLRILLAIDDGTVAYDSSKTNNTFTNFNVNNSINSSNHNTRPEIMAAILGSSGTAISNRFSKSVSKFQKYQATRLGASLQSNLGTFRVSLDDTL